MAENVVEDVRLLEIVELRLGADEGAGREAAVCEMLEKGVVRNETGDGDDAPSGVGREPLAQLRKVGNASAG